MPDPTFTEAPIAPSRQAPSTFAARMDAFLSYIVTFRAELVVAVSWIAAQVATIATRASEAAASAAAAATSAGTATQRATAASGSPGSAAASAGEAAGSAGSAAASAGAAADSASDANASASAASQAAQDAVAIAGFNAADYYLKTQTYGRGEVDTFVDGLNTRIDGHGHEISQVSGLQSALNGKAASGHGHTISQVTGLQSALNGKADAVAFATELDGKQSRSQKGQADGYAELDGDGEVPANRLGKVLSSLGNAASTNETVSGSGPSGGVNGDKWFQV